MTDATLSNNSKNLSAQVQSATSNIASATDGSVVNSTEIVSKMRSLIKALKILNHQYYVMDSPAVEDSEYDQMRRSLLEIEEEYPEPLRVVL